MSERERRLGKGLESLITAARGKSLNVDLVRRAGHRIQSIATSAIRPNPFQPRQVFSIEDLNELIESMRVHGLMQPIIVRRKEALFELIAGERRWRAATELGWETIDAVVVDADDRRMLEWALVENMQRQGLGPLELADAIRRLTQDFGLRQDEIARELGISRPAVANHLRLLELPDLVKDLVSRGTVSMGAARALLAFADREQLVAAAHRASRGELTVRQIENLAKLRPGSVAATREERPIDPNLAALAEEIQGYLRLKVDVRGSAKRGRIVIPYRSRHELDALVRRIRELADPSSALGNEDEQEELRA